ncbi:MAG: hypothetical protein WAU02_03470 [Candidatus Saccharimonadales bacterium]
MKQLIIAALVVIGLVAAPVHHVSAVEQYTNDADINAIEDAVKAINAFEAESQKETSTYETIHPLLLAASTKLDTLSKHNFSTAPGVGYTAAAVAVKDKARTTRAALDALGTKMTAADAAGAKVAGEAYDTAVKDFFAAIDRLNIAVDSKNKVEKEQDQMTGTSYIVTLVVAGILTAGSFAWAFLRKDQRPEVAAAQKAVAMSSLWPLGGAVITYGSYAMASNGGKYTIAWGAVVFGLYMFIQAILTYTRVKKTAPVPKA